VEVETVLLSAEGDPDRCDNGASAQNPGLSISELASIMFVSLCRVETAKPIALHRKSWSSKSPNAVLARTRLSLRSLEAAC